MAALQGIEFSKSVEGVPCNRPQTTDYKELKEMKMLQCFPVSDQVVCSCEKADLLKKLCYMNRGFRLCQWPGEWQMAS
jgi:hypothetical protein